jgi:hypothetical protein
VQDTFLTEIKRTYQAHSLHFDYLSELNSLLIRPQPILIYSKVSTGVLVVIQLAHGSVLDPYKVNKSTATDNSYTAHTQDQMVTEGNKDLRNRR